MQMGFHGSRIEMLVRYTRSHQWKLARGRDQHEACGLGEPRETDDGSRSEALQWISLRETKVLDAKLISPLSVGSLEVENLRFLFGRPGEDVVVIVGESMIKDIQLVIEYQRELAAKIASSNEAKGSWNTARNARFVGARGARMYEQESRGRWLQYLLPKGCMGNGGDDGSTFRSMRLLQAATNAYSTKRAFAAAGAAVVCVVSLRIQREDLRTH